jgi:hypothetical protein
VSRALSAFAASGLIGVSRRELKLNDVKGLRSKLESPTAKYLARRISHKRAVGSMPSSARVASRAASWSQMAA